VVQARCLLGWAHGRVGRCGAGLESSERPAAGRGEGDARVSGASGGCTRKAQEWAAVMSEITGNSRQCAARIIKGSGAHTNPVPIHGAIRIGRKDLRMLAPK